MKKPSLLVAIAFLAASGATAAEPAPAEFDTAFRSELVDRLVLESSLGNREAAALLAKIRLQPGTVTESDARLKERLEDIEGTTPLLPTVGATDPGSYGEFPVRTRTRQKPAIVAADLPRKLWNTMLDEILEDEAFLQSYEPLGRNEGLTVHLVHSDPKYDRYGEGIPVFRNFLKRVNWTRCYQQTVELDGYHRIRDDVMIVADSPHYGTYNYGGIDGRDFVIVGAYHTGCQRWTFESTLLRFARALESDPTRHITIHIPMELSFGGDTKTSPSNKPLVESGFPHDPLGENSLGSPGLEYLYDTWLICSRTEIPSAFYRVADNPPPLPDPESISTGETIRLGLYRSRGKDDAKRLHEDVKQALSSYPPVDLVPAELARIKRGQPAVAVILWYDTDAMIARLNALYPRAR